MDRRQSDEARSKYPYTRLIEDYRLAITFNYTYEDIYLGAPRWWLRKLLRIHSIYQGIELEIARQTRPSAPSSKRSMDYGGGIPISQWHRVFSNKVKKEGIAESDWRDIAAMSGIDAGLE